MVRTVGGSTSTQSAPHIHVHILDILISRLLVTSDKWTSIEDRW